MCFAEGFATEVAGLRNSRLHGEAWCRAGWARQGWRILSGARLVLLFEVAPLLQTLLRLVEQPAYAARILTARRIS